LTMSLFSKIVSLGAASAAGYVAIAAIGDQKLHPLQFQAFFWLVFALYISAVFVAWRAQTSDKRVLGAMFLVAVVIRLFMFVGPPTLTDDIYRYAWDGKVQTVGVNPYVHAATDACLRALQNDPLYARLCARYTQQAAVYPPLAEGFFFGAAASGVNPVYLIKFVLMLADLGSIWLLVLILRRLKLNPLRAIVYAWSPLAVIEVSQSGHIEGLAMLFVLAAVLAVLKGRDARGGALTALAVAAKFTPAIFLPALYRRRDWRFPAAFAAALAALCLPYLGGAKTLFGLATEEKNLPHFNAGIRGFLEAIFGRTDALAHIYSLGAVVVLGAIGLYVWLRQDGSDKRTMDGLWLMAAVFLVVTPFLPQWYVLIIVPFLAWRPSPAYLWLSGGVMLMYIIYLNPNGGYMWPGYVEYGVFFTLLIGEISFAAWRRLRGLTPASPG
jgi:alpha-1,6-mannosyltransferase